jgi:2,3-bisphosphoglycerate-independent phosphoglycerate mutase
MDPVEPGLACGSDTAHMSIFGYNPFTEYRGRGSFETIGSGIPMDDNEIAFKCNFAHMDEQGIVKMRRVDRDFDKWGLPLIDLIDGMKLSVFGTDDTLITAKHATEHRLINLR